MMDRILVEYKAPLRLAGQCRWLHVTTGRLHHTAMVSSTCSSDKFTFKDGKWQGDGECVIEVVAVPAVPVRPTDAAQAFKADAGKPDFDLLMYGMPEALLDVVKVLSWAVAALPCKPYPDGGKGYVPNSWKEVPEAKRRYRAALQRHENKLALGEVYDVESGLPHRAHIATNALFLAQLDYIKEQV